MNIESRGTLLGRIEKAFSFFLPQQDNNVIDRVEQWNAFDEEAQRHCGRLAVDGRLGFSLDSPKLLPLPEQTHYPVE